MNEGIMKMMPFFLPKAKRSTLDNSIKLISL